MTMLAPLRNVPGSKEPKFCQLYSFPKCQLLREVSSLSHPSGEDVR
jgi:hypothetical protein